MGCFGKLDSEEVDQLLSKSTDKDYSDTHLSAQSFDDENDRDITKKETDDVAHGQNPNKKILIYGSILAMFGAVVSTTSLACTQALDKSIPHSELNGLRYTVTLVICSGYVTFFNKCDAHVDVDSRGWLLLLALSVTSTSYATYGKAYYIPVGTGNGLNLSLEVILNVIVSAAITRSMRWNEAVASVICIVGVVMVVQPPLIFSHPGPALFAINTTFQSPCGLDGQNSTAAYLNFSNSTSAELVNEHRDYDTIIGYILCLVEAVSDVSYLNLVRYKMPPNGSAFVLTFWISLVAVIVSYGIMGAMEQPTMPRVSLCFVFLAVHMLTAGTTTLISVCAVRMIPPLWVVLIYMVKVPLLFIVQYTLLAGMFPGYRNTVEIIGGVLIIIGNVFVPLVELNKPTSTK